MAKPSSAASINNGVANGTDESSTSSAVATPVHTSTERDPLITRVPDPDDPIVSPLNLYRVHVLRWVLVGVLFVNAVLFIGFFLSIFVNVPGLSTRGQSFLELDLVIVNVLTDLLTLWVFAVAAYYERLLGYVTLAVVIVDFVVVFTVPPLRDSAGLLGLFLWIWTILNVGLNCFADYWVDTARQQQELKYIGRVEKRRSLFELLVIFVKIAVKLVLLVLVWNISLAIWLSGFDTHEKPWGTLVPVNEDSFSVHVACFGDVHNSSGQPIVLVEGGQRTSSEEFSEWIEELYHLNEVDRYCVWDRPGYAFSDSAPSPVSVGIISEYLIEALRKQNIEGPFSVVGFDLGGLYARMFASRNPSAVESLVLVDSWHEDLLKHNPFSNKKNEDRRTFRNFFDLEDSRTGAKLFFKGLASPLGLVTNLHWFLHPRKYSSNARIFGSDMVHSSKYLRARLQEQITASILSYSEIVGADVHSIPVAVISSDLMIKKSLNWGKWQRQLTKLSDNPIEWVVAEKAPHKIWATASGRKQLQDLLIRVLGDKRGPKRT